VSSDRRAWSVVTLGQFNEYLDGARRVAEFCQREKIEPFAAAMAGVSFIRMALETMGGEVEWWVEWVRTGQLPQSWPLVPIAKPSPGPAS
jgi:hypothetical protein